jgi:hypothetical protein
MRKRDLRVGLHIKVNGEHGVTMYHPDYGLIMECFSVYGGEGFHPVSVLNLRDRKLVDRVYDPRER